MDEHVRARIYESNCDMNVYNLFLISEGVLRLHWNYGIADCKIGYSST